MANNAPKQFSNVPIVFIDDFEVSHSILTQQLKQYGLVPFCINSPSRGLALLRRAREQNIPIPILVCDYHMAGITGLELTEIIRNDSSIDGTQIIILTNAYLGGLVRKFRDLNVHHFLERPCSAKDLVKAIQEYIPADTVINPSFTNNHGKDSKGAPASTSLSVLAVDDDSTNLLVIEGYLKNSGYKVDLARNGLEAITAYKKALGTYEMVLMDIAMPIMNGVTATQHIRKLESRLGFERTPIIAVTAHSHASQRLIYTRAGMDDLIRKPMHKRAFDTMLSKWNTLPHSEALLANG